MSSDMCVPLSGMPSMGVFACCPASSSFCSRFLARVAAALARAAGDHALACASLVILVIDLLLLMERHGIETTGVLPDHPAGAHVDDLDGGADLGPLALDQRTDHRPAVVLVRAPRIAQPGLRVAQPERACD